MTYLCSSPVQNNNTQGFVSVEIRIQSIRCQQLVPLGFLILSHNIFFKMYLLSYKLGTCSVLQTHCPPLFVVGLASDKCTWSHVSQDPEGDIQFCQFTSGGCENLFFL